MDKGMEKGKLYLFPSLLAPVETQRVLPQFNTEMLRSIKYFVVEELRTARRFLKACDRSIDIDSCSFEVLNEHTPAEAVDAMLAPLINGNDLGVISEAGCPAVADPGADLVAAAQRKGIKVVPLVGPSSILLALMGSGFNGQSFAFLGYLPVDVAARASVMREMEKNIRRGQTQIFIETPYRNNRLAEEICRSMPSELKLCIASNLTSDNQMIITRPLGQWKNNIPDLNKKPTIFLLYK